MENDVATTRPARSDERVTDSERINRLEERIAHLQQHVAAQDKAMLELHETLVRLEQQLATLRGKVGGTGSADGPAEDRPPHY